MTESERNSNGAAGTLESGLAVARAAVAGVLALAILVVFAGVAPTFFGAETFAMQSGSMAPALQVGALAVVRPVRSEEIGAGDIITYRTPTQPDVVVTHRVLAIVRTEDGRRQFKTKGDANDAEDLVLVDAGGVLGKVIYSVPYAGYIVEFSRTARGRLLLIGLPALLVALDYARARAQQHQRSARRVAAPTSAPLQSPERAHALVARGREALDSGFLALAERAADGALAIDPRNEDAWLLKAESQPDATQRRLLLQTALTIVPQAGRVAARLEQVAADEPPPARRATGHIEDRDGRAV